MPSYRLQRQRCRSSVSGAWRGAQQVRFKWLWVLTKFSATGSCSVPSSFPFYSQSSVCLRLALRVMLHTLCRLFPVSEGSVAAVNWTRPPVHGDRARCGSKCHFPRREKYFCLMIWFRRSRSRRCERAAVVAVWDGMFRVWDEQDFAQSHSKVRSLLKVPYFAKFRVRVFSNNNQSVPWHLMTVQFLTLWLCCAGKFNL